MREIVHLQVGQCGNQIGSKVINYNKKKHTSIYKYKHTTINIIYTLP